MNSLSISNVANGSTINAISAKNNQESALKNNEAFQQLFSCMLLSSMGQITDNNNDGTSLLPPLMLLLEQLQAQQLNSELESSSTTSLDTSEVADPWNSPSANHSYPVKGRLTQNSHSGHIALDFGVVVGTPVHSTIEGKVTYAGWSEAGYGNLVIVENGPYKTYYAHLSEIPVTIGQTIQQGDVIGLSGNTGNSTGPHVHYEVRHKNQRINPNSFNPDTL